MEKRRLAIPMSRRTKNAPQPDLAGRDEIQSKHLAEALQYRLKIMLG